MTRRLCEKFGGIFETSDRNTFLLAAFIAVLSLLLRIEDLSYLSESLWAEDGDLLINQAHELGLSSLWQPYSGYLHVYHRIFALISTLAPLEVTPYIFLAGWVIAFLLIVWVVVSRGTLAGIDRLTSIFLVLAISLQPTHGEAYWNLGQSFYFLNIAFALYVCLPSTRSTTVPYAFLLAVLSLSGPASEILSVVLLMRLIVLRDFKIRKLEYLTVWACASVQILLTAVSTAAHSAGRFSTGVSLSDWMHGIVVFLSFGSQSRLVYIAAVILWSIISIGLLSLFGNSKKTALPLLLATVMATAFLLAGMIRQDKYMVIMSPVDHGSRYYLLPYALAFFVALSVTRYDAKVKMVALFSIGIICGASFLTVDRADRRGSTGAYAHENLQWVAFTKFQKVNPSVMIPINPPWAVWPGGYVKVGADSSTQPTNEYKLKSISLNIREMTSENSTLDLESDALNVFSERTSPRIDFTLDNNCAGKEFLALEVDVWRSKPGWARLYWRGSDVFSQRKSLVRFYMDGDAKMQFAFRREASDSSLRLDLMQGVEKWIMQDAAKEAPQLVVPPPTAPGGRAKIRKISLFCLS